MSRAASRRQEASQELLYERWEGHPYFRRGLHAIPPLSARMKEFPAGSVTIGVEHRDLTTDIVEKHFTSAGFEPPQIEDTDGPSLHVFGTDNEYEYLRFDIFPAEPHYHYFVPGLDGITKFQFDTHMLGDMTGWLCANFAERLGALLSAVGADDLMPGVKYERIVSALSYLKDYQQQVGRGLKP